MLSNNDANRTTHREGHGQLGMPGGGHELIETFVPIGSREQQRITLMSLVDLFNRMTDAEIVAVHMTSNNEHHCNRHVVMCDVSHPETAGDRIQTTFKGEEIAVGSPVTGEEC